jgi:CHAT domain-containing protein
MLTQMIDYPIPNGSVRKSLRLSLLLVPLLCMQIAHSANAQAVSDELQFIAAARQKPVAELINKLKFVGRPQQDPQEVTSIGLGKPVENEISGGQVQSYRINLSAGQFVSVIVQQRGIDVIEKVFAPDGKLVAQFDSELRPQEAETAEFVAETQGVYRLDVKAKIKGAVGRYEIRVAEIRAANEQDRSLHEAHRLSTESSILFRAGKYDEAVSLAARALDIAEKALGTDHVYVAYLLSGLGNKQLVKGDYAKAEASLQRALAINEKALGPEHPQTVESLGALGLVYESTDDYVKAGRMLQQALEITERTLGAEHPKVADYLVMLGGLHSDLSDVEQAEREWRRALTIAEKTLEPDDKIIAQALNDLGYIYLFKKEYELSETFLQRALAIYEKSFGAEHPYLYGPLLNLGRVYREKKDYVRALEMYRRGLAIAEKTFGPESIEVASLLNNIANIYKVKGDYAKALELHQRVLKTAEKSAGPYQYLTILSLGNIANLYAALGDTANAIAFQTRVDERLERALALNLAIGSERQKLAYFNSLSERTSRTISLHVNLAPSDRTAGALATLVLLQRKGRILDAMSDILTALRQRFDSQDQKLLDQLNSTTAQLAKLALNGAQKMEPDEYQKQLRSLEEQKETLEAEISQRSAEFRAQSQPVTLSAVQAAIPRNAALIEFASYRPFNPRAENNNEAYGKPHYVAYVVREQGDVQWKELGEAQAIDASVDELRQALRDPQRNDVQRLARDVDEKVMQPVRALTGDATQLLISPDGELNLIPFAALVDEQGRYLIQRYSFAYLTSGRDLLRMQVARESKSKPLVVANPSFGEPATELLATTAKPTAPSSRRRSVTTGRDLSEVYFAPLGGTAQEARSIRTLFPDANVLSAAQATESAVKQVNAPRVLHLATHGFFLSEPGALATGSSAQIATTTSNTNTKSASKGVATGSPTQVTTRGTNATAVSVPPAVAGGSVAPTATRGISASAKIANPLLRSGLALANANLRSGSSEDGILTALEASGLNLWGTKLVVLSACDTGVGEVRNGEGVYGLRRAFVLAGAESLVMSLWPVSDYTTRELMTRYYTNLKQGMGRGAGLRTVQLDMLRRNPKLHPFYWANFIQSGEWANLDGKR